MRDIIEIDRGSDQGLKVGMPVVAGAGLVGKVTEVQPTRSVIKLLTDPDIVVGVRLVSSGETALLHGQGDGQPLVVDAGVDPKTPVAPAEQITTSGEDRAVYPAGISHVLVNGKPVLLAGKRTRERPGRPLLRVR